MSKLKKELEVAKKSNRELPEKLEKSEDAQEGLLGANNILRLYFDNHEWALRKKVEELKVYLNLAQRSSFL